MTPSKTIKLSEVKTPTTVEEFRNNLRTYFVTVDSDKLVVKGGSHMEVPITEIEHLDDLYKITQTGWNRRPTVEQKEEVEKIKSEYGGSYTIEEMIEERQRIAEIVGPDSPSITPLLDNEEDFDLYDNQQSWLDNSSTKVWCRLDNQMMRGFYVEVLGEFSGYVSLDCDA